MPQPVQPNIIVILTDDQRWDTVTPEAMPYWSARREQGVVFTNAIATTAICGAARTSFFTGNLASRTGVKTNVNAAGLSQPLAPNMLAKLLHDAGYYTGLVGKYLNDYDLLGPPHQPMWYVPPGWDSWTAFAQNANNYLDYPLVFGPASTVAGMQAYSTDLFAEYAWAFIRNRPVAQPYFLLLAPFGPHLGFDMQPGRYAELLQGLPPWRPPNFNEADVSDKGAPVRAKGLIVDPSGIDTNRRLQLEALLAVDDLIRVIDRAVTAKTPNTIIVVLSDQGYFWGEHRLQGKNFPYDEAHRFPLSILWPETLAPRVEAGLVTHCDVSRTLAAWAGAAPLGLDGISFATTLPANQPLARTVVPLESWLGNGASFYTGERTLATKDILWSATTEAEHYNLSSDPYELQNTLQP